MKISEIKSELESADWDSLSQVMDSFRNDERSGVQKLIAQFEKKKEAYDEIIKDLESDSTNVEFINELYSKLKNWRFKFNNDIIKKKEI